MSIFLLPNHGCAAKISETLQSVRYCLLEQFQFITASSGNQFGFKKALVVLMQLHNIEVLMSRGCTVKSLGNRSL